MNINEMFPSKYIKAADLKGRLVTVVMAKVEVEKIGDDQKYVLYFQGKEKGLVLNKTNGERIGNLYGPSTDEWVGREIVLYGDWVNFQGKQTEAIRVRAPEKRVNNTHQIRPVSGGGQALERIPEGQTPTSDMSDEIPF